MAREVTIRISAQDNFSAVMDKYNRAMNQANKATDDLGDKAEKNARGVSVLSNALSNVIGPLSAIAVLKVGAELYNMGQAANAAEATFAALAGGADKAREAMNLMREATRGTVDDMSLQQNASRLLQMGIAQTAEELAKFSQIASVLGSSMGKDVNQAMEDFALMMANQSYLRLDTFGISAGVVRARVQELKKELGVDTQRAFSMAVLEQAEVSMNKLGAAAGAAISPVQQLSIAFQNLGQDIAQNVNTGVNSLIGLLQLAAGTHPLQTGRTGQLMGQFDPFFQGNAMNMMQAYLSTLPPADMAALMKSGVSGPTSEGDFDINIMAEMIKRAFGEMGKDPAITAQKAMERAMESGDYAGWSKEGMSQAFAYYWETYLENAKVAEEAAQKQNIIDVRKQFLADMPKRRQAMYQAGNIPYADADSYRQVMAELSFRKEQQALAQGSMGSLLWQWDVGLSAAQSLFPNTSLTSFGTQFSNRRMTDRDAAGQLTGQYMRPEDAARVKNAYSDMLVYLDQLKEFERLKLISSDEVEAAQTLADNMGKVADAAGRAASAFENLSLAEVFGQKGGGLMGEIGDKLMDILGGKEGADPGKMQQLQRALDLASGRQTAMGARFEDEIAPFIADIATNLGDAAAVKAVQNLTQYFQNAKVQGWSDARTMAGLGTATGYMRVPGAPGGGGGQQIVIQPGDTLSGLAAQYGMTIQQLMPIVGTTNPNLIYPGTYGGGSTAAGAGGIAQIPPFIQALQSGGGIVNALQQQGGILGGIGNLWAGTIKYAKSGKSGAESAADNIATSMSEAVTQADALAASLDSIPAEKTVKINIVAEGLEALLSIVGGALSVAVANNGGTVPGTTGTPGTGASGRTSTGTLGGRGSSGRNRPID